MCRDKQAFVPVVQGLLNIRKDVIVINYVNRLSRRAPITTFINAEQII